MSVRYRVREPFQGTAESGSAKLGDIVVAAGDSKKAGWLLVRLAAGSGSEYLLPSNICQVLRRAVLVKDANDAARHIAVRKGDVVEVYHTADEDLGLVDALLGPAFASVVTLPLAVLKFDDDATAATTAVSASLTSHKKSSGARVQRSGKSSSSSNLAASRDDSNNKDAPKKDERKRRHSKKSDNGAAAAAVAATTADAPQKKGSSRKICEKCATAPAVAVVEFDGAKLMLCKPCMLSDVSRRQQSGEATDIVVVQAKDAPGAQAAGKAAAAAAAATTPAAATSSATAAAGKTAVAAAPAAAGKAARVCKQCGDSKVAARVKIDGKVELLCKACTVKRQAQYATPPSTLTPATAVTAAAPKATSAPNTPAAASAGGKAAAAGSAPVSPARGPPEDDGAMMAEDSDLGSRAAAPDWAAIEPLFQKRTKLGRKVALKEVLVWSKKPIEKPLLKLPKLHEKKGEQLAAWVHEYITFEGAGDDTPALTAAQQALAAAIRTAELRDELYALLVRYMSHCDDLRQLWRTWKLWAMATPIFPAAAAMTAFFLGVLSRWQPTGHAPCTPDDRRALRKYRRWVFEQFKATSETRSVSARTPPIDELRFYETAPLGPPSLFGCTLARAMQIQREHYPQFGSRLPLVVSLCMRHIRELDGFKVQGIFRLPGNTDNIKALQLQVNKGDFALAARSDITVHDIASLLKLWLRGLSEPLIPDALYATCIDNPDSVKNAMDVYGALPELNKDLVARLLNFLQTIAYPENQELNKMSLSNLSVVFAPCLLRYPMSSDTLTIMANTVKEQAFVLTLLGLPLLDVVDTTDTTATADVAPTTGAAAAAAVVAAPAAAGAAATPAGDAGSPKAGATVAAAAQAEAHRLRRLASVRPTPSAREAPASSTAASQTDDAIGRTPAGASPLITRLQSRIGGRGSRSASVGSAAEAGVNLNDGGASIAAAAVAALANEASAGGATAAATAEASASPASPPPLGELKRKSSRGGAGSGELADSPTTAAHKKKTTSLGKAVAMAASEAAVTRSDRSLKKRAAAEAAEAAQVRASQALKKKLAEPRDPSLERRTSKGSTLNKRGSDAPATPEGANAPPPTTTSGSKVQRVKSPAPSEAAPPVPLTPKGGASQVGRADEDDQSSASSDEASGGSKRRGKAGKGARKPRSLGGSGIGEKPPGPADVPSDKPQLPDAAARADDNDHHSASDDEASGGGSKRRGKGSKGPKKPRSRAGSNVALPGVAGEPSDKPPLPDVGVRPPETPRASSPVPIASTELPPMLPDESDYVDQPLRLVKVDSKADDDPSEVGHNDGASADSDSSSSGGEDDDDGAALPPPSEPPTVPAPTAESALVAAVELGPVVRKNDDDDDDDDDGDESSSAISIDDHDAVPAPAPAVVIEVEPFSDSDDEQHVEAAPAPAQTIVTMLSDLEDDDDDDDDDGDESGEYSETGSDSGSDSPLPPPSS